MQPSTNMSKKSGVVSNSTCSTFAASFSIRARISLDTSIIVAPSSAAFPTFTIRSDGTLAMNPTERAFPTST